MVDFGVLGPLQAANDRGPVRLKGPRHRAVLARLLIAKGRVVPVAWLADDLWDDPPEGAVGALQTFVGELRKALEPDRPPRTPSDLLVTIPPGYALHLPVEAVDVGRFEAAVAESGPLLATGRAQEALDRLDAALGLWRGPAYVEFAAREWARAEAARLDELRTLAVARHAEAALALGRAADVVPDLEAAVTANPLHEQSWRLLALALYRTGRQGDALAALRRARRTLSTELGLDPGEPLRTLEIDILTQSGHLAAPGPHDDRATGGGHPFVGRETELADLERSANAARATRRPRLILLSGDPGAGKTALAEALAARLRARGWLVAGGASPETPGAPAAWPWTRMEQTLADAGFGRPDAVPGDGDPVAARFQRRQAIAAHLARIARRRPVLLLFDDLHWADEETLALLIGVAGAPDPGAVVVVGTYRSTEVSAGLTEALGRAARLEPVHIALGGLTEPQVRELMRTMADRDVDPAAARVVHTRGGGNPFFVRELTRLWTAEGEAGLDAVPTGVRDVIRQRLARLPEPVRTLLRQAAVVGDEVGLDVLTGLAGRDVQADTEAALGAGFLIERDADRLNFAHDLVRETLYDDLPRSRRARWHATVAEIVERIRPADVETIAHHYLRADSRATAVRAARYAAAAAERAEQRGTPHAAADWWRAAVDRTGHDDMRARLRAVMGLVRALAITGDLIQARRHHAAAIDAAEALGDPLLTAEVIGSYRVPAIWPVNDDEDLSRHVVAAAEQTLAALPAEANGVRARLLIAIAMERRADAGPRGGQAARAAEAIARDLRDPALLALALNGRFLQTFERAGLAPQRAGIGRELVTLAAGHDDLVTFEVLGHLILIQAYAALADFRVADRHAAAADRLAERFDLPVVSVFTDFYRALRLAVAGRRDEAEAAYRTLAARLPATGMSGMGGVLPLALLSVGAAVDAYRPDPAPRDLLFEAHAGLLAADAIRTGDAPAMRRLYDELVPAADELAGAASGMLSFGPVAGYLADLADALGRPDDAAEHQRRAAAVAKRLTDL
jgi:DNA-binding SARP family transcriptional activator